ncbi:protein phosphatase methylesterase 1-like [Zophobas morio]|uniref:protein phosphatase methylesterase 1-like n=1 Tax=Zophobas morio TaxID=2755281 RepID=UPI003082B881
MGTLFETESMPPLVLVGHSMGGAIAVHLAESGAFSSLLAVVIIDAIEGTAMLALPAMKNILRSRPPGFSSLENAIKWSVISGQIRNLESARVSVPGQICLNSQIPHHQKISIVDTSEDIIKEEEEETSQTQSLVNFLYTWRADLARSEKFWPGWFHGITAKFLSTSAMKLLIVTGLDKLDTELTIAQMQGKFQVGIVPFAGHNVHEDAPEKVAEIIADFLKRFKICSRLNKSCRWPS